MSTSQSEHARSLRQAQGLVRRVSGCNPQNLAELGQLQELFGELRTSLKSEGADVENALCGLASQLVDLLERHGQISGRHGLMIATDILSHVVVALGGKRGVDENGEEEAAPTEEKAESEPSLGLRLMDQRKLGEILVSLTMLTPDQLERALKHQKALGKRLGETLVELGYLNKASVDSALRMQRRHQGTRTFDHWSWGSGS